MKKVTRFGVVGAAGLIAVSMAVVMRGQSAPSATPPIKMGLWHSTIVSKMSGLELPPEAVERLKAMGRPVPGEPRTVESEGCLTQEKWKEMLARGQQRENCSLTNIRQDDKGMSADIACASRGGGMSGTKGHVQFTFVSSEKVHGTTHVETMTSQQPQPVVMDATLDSVYEGADCKGISPDTPKVIVK